MLRIMLIKLIFRNTWKNFHIQKNNKEIIRKNNENDSAFEINLNQQINQHIQRPKITKNMQKKQEEWLYVLVMSNTKNRTRKNTIHQRTKQLLTTPTELKRTLW